MKGQLGLKAGRGKPKIQCGTEKPFALDLLFHRTLIIVKSKIAILTFVIIILHDPL